MMAAGTVPMSLNDEAEADSFAGFFRSTNRRAYAFALHLTGNGEDAMDIVQEAYLRMHERWTGCAEPGKAAAWLYTIIRNLAVDHLRRRARRGETELEEGIAGPLVAGPEEAAAQSEVSRRLWEAIRSLPHGQREILLLRDWHGLNYAEIAEVLGLSMGTVSSRLHHAREKVREAMEGFLR
ncbi:MAG: sigma-70 family RNA polymerase sigma factor [Bryobacteraceae bacterium]|nr:sigma-70 family RNA polymerase sigma factor [Bryobacteraceae bacterium]